MESDPTTARLAGGRLSRLRARRAATVADVPAEAVVATHPSGPAAPKGLADVEALVEDLTRHGHAVRVSDRTEPGVVPAGVGRVAYLVLEDVVAILVRRAPSDQRVHVRIRTEDGDLVLAVQTLPDGDRPRPFAVGAHEEAALRRRIETASGRATIRATHGGNWLAMARLPL